jgi:hypothetical protein
VLDGTRRDAWERDYVGTVENLGAEGCMYMRGENMSVGGKRRFGVGMVAALFLVSLASPALAQESTTESTNGDSALTAAQVQSFTCAEIYRYSEVAGVDEYQYFSRIFERRLSQCRSGNVITGTIPGGNLPNTGGMSVWTGVSAVLGLGLVATGASIVRAAGARRRS